MNDQNDLHRLFAVQEAMNLPSNYYFGDTLDVVFGSLLENLVFLSACNIVHRDCEFLIGSFAIVLATDSNTGNTYFNVSSFSETM